MHRGSARSWLHISDAVRAIEAAVQVKEYSAINIGHPDVVPIATLAEMIRRELGADPSLVREVDLPARMTSIKRPVLERMRNLLGVEPTVSLQDGVARVCARARERLQAAGSAST